MTEEKKIPLVNQPVWERQPGETPMQYLWFTRYRDMRLEGGSFADVCQKYGKKPVYSKVLRLWSPKNRWVHRIELYRDFLENKKAEQRLKDIEDMNDRQSLYGRLMQQIAMQIVNDNQADGKKMNLSIDQIAKWMEIGAKIERTARGAPTEIRSDADLPEEERKRMESIYMDAMAEISEIVPKNYIERRDDINSEMESDGK